MTAPLLSPAETAALRADLADAGYTPDGVTDRLGEPLAAALARGDLRAVRHAVGAGDPLDTLIRLFPAGGTVPGKAAAAAFGRLGLDAAVRVGLLEPIRDGDPAGRPAPDPAGDPAPDSAGAGGVVSGGVRAALDLRPYGDEAGSWWVVSDLGSDVRPGPLRSDHVLGVGAASVTLAQATTRRPVARALDLGTGCGVQALHLSRHADAVTVTDVTPRALTFAATTAALNGLSWELLAGDLAAPVRGRRFDLVVSNPPFVAGPGVTTHAYRDSGRPGDAMSAEAVAAVAGLLEEGGLGQLLANWLHLAPGAGEPWEERVGGWLAATGCDALAVQREALDPAGYVALWLRDAGELEGPAADRRTAEWLDWFAAHRVEAVGFGLVSLRAGGRADPVVRVEEAHQPADPPLGPEVAAWFDRQDWLRSVGDPAALLRARLVAAPALRLRQTAAVGPDGWEVDEQLLWLDAGWRWAQAVDPITVALVAGCDGSARLGDQLAVLAAAYQADPAALAAAAVPLVTHLVERGMLLPAQVEGDR